MVNSRRQEVLIDYLLSGEGVCSDITVFDGAGVRIGEMVEGKKFGCASIDARMVCRARWGLTVARDKISPVSRCLRWHKRYG